MIRTIYSRAFTVLSRKPLRLWGLSLLSSVLVFASAILFGVIPGVALGLKILLATGMTMVFLHGYLGEQIAVPDLFECFKDWKTVKRVTLGKLYALMWIVLWGLIPIVGIVFAIIRSYDYALVPYILVMEPDIAITDACKESKSRMKGYKGKKFLADLLWALIVGLAIGILTVLAKIPWVGIIFGIAAFLLSLALSLFGKLFSGLIDSAFYVEIGHITGKGPQFDDSMNNPAPKPVKSVPAPGPNGYVPNGAVKYCPNCGTKLSAEARFCMNCGYGFAAPAAPTAPAAPSENENLPG